MIRFVAISFFVSTGFVDTSRVKVDMQDTAEDDNLQVLAGTPLTAEDDNLQVVVGTTLTQDDASSDSVFCTKWGTRRVGSVDESNELISVYADKPEGCHILPKIDPNLDTISLECDDGKQYSPEPKSRASFMLKFKVPKGLRQCTLKTVCSRCVEDIEDSTFDVNEQHTRDDGAVGCWNYQGFTQARQYRIEKTDGKYFFKDGQQSGELITGDKPGWMKAVLRNTVKNIPRGTIHINHIHEKEMMSQHQPPGSNEKGDRIKASKGDCIE